MVIRERSDGNPNQEDTSVSRKRVAGERQVLRRHIIAVGPETHRQSVERMWNCVNNEMRQKMPKVAAHDLRGG